ncbi:GTP cyclohydrolase I FolE [Fluviispira multicolorata]|uniref:GTP cyclohydrolase 1 n=1 Tax=Fluviispira multicolorata TaxID=2654512 RepID=A0A833N4Z3_9BACT|nr:GTP cyclohydrolase I FolE [Fluviispira multicolorata]KAB8033337.1 GTP cyclohydrolase I FolE [Fluviispira multicolorata]
MSPFFKKAISSNNITAKEATDAVRTLLRYIGENPDREGLIDTPDRFCRALLELTEGYSSNPEEILSTTFESQSDEMILLKDIEFTSTCEHHLLNFSGKAHVAYIPSEGKIVGLSKLARIVDTFSQRLQVQERLTQQVAEAIAKHLNPQGVAVVFEGTHSCMCVRGVRKQSAKMVTSTMLGQFRDSAASRNEFMSFITKN